MLAAEAAYCAMEDELREYLNSYESTHDYDEYHFDLDEIEHDPYVLISMITALKGGEWTIDEIGGILEMLFEKQYILTETVATETRYRTETHIGYYTDENGNLQSYEYADVQEKNGYEVVSVTKQTVYVIDTLNDRGEVYNSRLMIVTEALQYKSDLKLKGNTWVGEDGETHQGGKLSIFLVVYKDSSRNYYAYGTADWENGVYSGGINGPAAGYDFLAITWGGGGELKNTDRSISGAYQYNQGNISFSRAQSDTYCGYCWQFNETKGAYFADYIDCYAKLQKTYSTYKGKETNIRLTYIHTYQSTVGSISFQGGSSGVAAGVSLSSCNKQWQIEIDVPGIYY